MLNTNTYITVEQLLEHLRQSGVDYQSAFLKIYNPNAGATVQVSDTAIILKTTAGGTDTLTFADADKDTISELISAINGLAKSWVVNQLCQAGQASTNLQVIPETACVGSDNELTLTGYDLLYLENVINMTADTINTFLGRNIKSATYTNEEYNGTGSKELLLKNYPISEITKVENYDQQLQQSIYELTANTDYTAYMSEGYLYKWSDWAPGIKNYRITYKAGYETAAMPNDIKLAALKICALEISMRGKAGIASERIGNYSVSFTSGLSREKITYIPSDIAELLIPYKRWDR